MQKVWLDNKFLDIEKAKVGILTHSLQYGSGIFEGIRSYKLDNSKTAIFRLDEHIQRFFKTAKIYSMDLNYSADEIKKAIKNLLKINKLGSSYIRPFAFYNDQKIGLSPINKKISVFIAAIQFGNYFTNKDKGIKCKISSWNRINSSILPVEAKASGNYINSIIANLEARHSGFDEAILLSNNGYVAEGPGENIFIVKDNILITPDNSSDILLGLTRDSIIKIAENMGIEVIERKIHKEELYTSDEIFFSGTAAEITPIINVDGIDIQKQAGPITKLLSDKFNNIVHGNDKEFNNWLTLIS
ncbi:MAG: branched-chain amino acid transaminase [Candidatus Marsarchaeota archaeon]|jgi:branched-chain amino acid aminotransferase, group I|nr:branched-chain amino acid transaminase [Candidatus Marsarchaeota archaeon]MCL5095086.1 branched-chain amino acid transaminase [Candidatus Marsarchaeota archaeon]